MQGYNRTYVELKPDIQGVCQHSSRRYNRTIVELKQLISIIVFKLSIRYNRTIVELKLSKSPEGAGADPVIIALM